MAGSLIQIARQAALPVTGSSPAGPTQIPSYDAGASDIDFTIGGDGVALAAGTRAIAARDADNATGFKWAIVSAADAAEPDTTMRWFPGNGIVWFGVEPKAGDATRYFKAWALA